MSLRWARCLAMGAVVVMGMGGSLAVAAGSPAGSGSATDLAAPGAPIAAPPATDVTGLPDVPTSITNGTPAQTLLDRAQALTAAGQALAAPAATAGTPKAAPTAASTTAPAVSAAQAALTHALSVLDADTVTSSQAQSVAVKARRAVSAARAGAQRAASDYRGLDASLKAAAIRLYMDGPVATPALKPGRLDQLLEAGAYEQTTLTPQGILNRRRADQEIKAQELGTAKTDAATAGAAATRAATALMAAAGAKRQLSSQLATLEAMGEVTPAAVAVVANEADSLASQAGQELTSASSLEFAPAAPLPAPLATTDVALDWAFSELGKEYVWGGAGPDVFDCSGLTQYIWAQAGVAIPRVAADQDAWTIPVPLAQLLPGDLVFYGTTDIHHVGIYIGDGLMINAPHTGTVVQVSSIWWSDLNGFGRVHAAGVPVPTHEVPSASAPATPAVAPAAGPVPSQAVPPLGSDVPGSTVVPGVGPLSSPSSITTTTAGGGNSAPVTSVPAAPATTTTTTVPATTSTSVGSDCPDTTTTTTVPDASSPSSSTTSSSTTSSSSTTTSSTTTSSTTTSSTTIPVGGSTTVPDAPTTTSPQDCTTTTTAAPTGSAR